MQITDSLTQVVAPGTAGLSLKKGTNYTVFLEEESASNGEEFLTTGAMIGLACGMKSKFAGEAVGIWHPKSSGTYPAPDRKGRSVFALAVPERGESGFGLKYVKNTYGPEWVVAVGAGVGTGMLKIFFTCRAGMLVGGVVAPGVFSRYC